MIRATSSKRRTNSSRNDFLPAILTQSDSSEDEDFEKMLDYQPFSQESTTVLSTTNTTTTTTNTDTRLYEKENETFQSQQSQESSSKKQSQTEQSQQTEQDDPVTQLDMKLVQRKAQNIPFPLHMPSLDELHWHSETRRKKRHVYPCRLCNKDEAIGLDIPTSWDTSKYVLIQYMGTLEPNLRQLVLTSQVWKYNESGPQQKNFPKNTLQKQDEMKNDNDTKDDKSLPLQQQVGEKVQQQQQQWCPKTMKEYLDKLKSAKKFSLLEIKVEEIFLQRLLDHVQTREDTKQNQKKTRTTLPKEEEKDSSKDDTQKDTIPKEKALQTQQKDTTTTPATQGSEHAESDDDDDQVMLPLRHKQEELCVGDVIEYTNIMFVAGSKQGQRRATILSVNAKRSPVLVLDNGEYLEKDHPIRRVQYKNKKFSNQLINVRNAHMRPIQSFILRTSKGNLSFGAGVKAQTKRTGKTIRQNMEKLQQKIQEQKDKNGEPFFAPMDILHRYKGVEKKRGKHLKEEKETTCTRTKEEEEKDQVETQGWKRKLEERLSEMEKLEEGQSSSKRRRRSTFGSGGGGHSKSVMTKEHIQLAINVRQMIATQCARQDMKMEDYIQQELVEKLELSPYRLEKFLQGDEQKLLRLKQHEETAESLQKWILSLEQTRAVARK